MNLHTHTNYCDGKSEPITVIQAALELKWDYIGFSSHAPLPFPSAWAMKKNLVHAYSKEIAALKVHFEKEITIYTGWEIDYIPGKGFPALEFKEVVNSDYLIFSVHYLPNPNPLDEIGGFLEIDGDFRQFNQLVELYNRDLKSLLNDYILALTAIFKYRSPCQKIIGHLDKIIINASKLDGYKLLQTWFEQSIIDLFKNHYNGEDLIEINSRPIYLFNRSIPYPGITILKYLSSESIPCILTSDAHFASELNLGFEDIHKLLQKLNLNVNLVNPHKLNLLQQNQFIKQDKTTV